MQNKKVAPEEYRTAVAEYLAQRFASKLKQNWPGRIFYARVPIARAI